MWALPLVAVLVWGFMAGWQFGWRRGKLLGDRAHADCHQAQEAARDRFLKSVLEHADMQAWEEEL